MAGYQVPVSRFTYEAEIKRSKFIVDIQRVSAPEQARAFIAQLKNDFPDANHHCSAFIAGAPSDSQVLGFSDDGEPAGTAGKPMLNVLMGRGVGEIVAVTTRYFGGIKLGTGGLVKAYGGTLADAMALLPLEQMVPTSELHWEMEYSALDRFEHMLAQYRGEKLSENFGSKIQLSTLVPTQFEQEIKQRVEQEFFAQVEYKKHD